MNKRIAFDLSGLAWKYRTGVQNLYWAFVDAWVKQPQLFINSEVFFYDRSGCFNQNLYEILGERYRSCAPTWWPSKLRRPLQVVIRSTNLNMPKLSECVNHVWNWGIYSPPDCRSSITIPDVLPLEYPQWFNKKFINLTEKSLRFAIDRAEYVFTISYDVKKRVCKLTGISPHRIHVVYPSISPSFFLEIDFNQSKILLDKHRLIPHRYLISSGFLDPRKNLERQLLAFSLVIGKGISDLKYVITGIKTRLSKEILKIIELPHMKDKVIFLDYVSNKDLINITSQSAALMYCGIAEGFGLPIIQSMALGVPIITSANTSMQEIGKNKAYLVNPEDVEAIAEKIMEVVHLPQELKNIQLDINKKYASKFTIENWLCGHLDIFSGNNHALQNRWV